MTETHPLAEPQPLAETQPFAETQLLAAMLPTRRRVRMGTE